MDFELGKINRILKDFEIAVIKKVIPITEYLVLKGNAKGGETLDTTNWKIYKTGEPWGGYAKHMWFRTKLCIPSKIHGERVFFRINTGHKEGWDISNPQFLCYINGRITQGLDVNHRRVLLSESAKEDEVYEIALLGHSGFNQGFVYLETELAVEDLAIKDFYYNLKNLFRVACILEPDDTNRIIIMEGINKAVCLLDLRKFYSKEFYDGLHAANTCLQDQFYSAARTEGPVVTTIGHTHIDVAWLWTVEQTKEKVVRSFTTVLNYMEQYPEYKFMSSQPQLYEFLKQEEPTVYEQVKEKIAQGRWEVDGGMWLEADCNLPCGESLVRQLLYGIRFIQTEFQKKCRTLWLPDVFGYSAALPQLLKKSGISYFFTTKLDWNQYNKMPHDTFLWKGIDGSEILTQLVTTTEHVTFDNEVQTRKNRYRQTTYNGRLEANQILGNWTKYQDKPLCKETLQLFGFGDGGGGPTEEQLENYKRLKFGLPGIPSVRMDFQGNYFERLEQCAKQSKQLTKWAGELYLECHRGTYTSMAKNKRYNRNAELLYLDLETLLSMEYLLSGTWNTCASNVLERNWKKILLNQFHDIIPGTSIEAVYKQTDAQYKSLLREGSLLLEDTIEELASKVTVSEDSIVVFNTLSFERNDTVTFTLPDEWEGRKIFLIDEKSQCYSCQQTLNAGEYIGHVEVIPPKGYRTFNIRQADEDKNEEQAESLRILESPYVKLHFNENYEIVSCWDKQAEREVLPEGKAANILEVYEDRPMDFENWDIDIYYKDKCYEITHVKSVQLVENGSVRTILRIERDYFNSSIIQDIIIYQHQRRIDFHTKLDWHEKQVLLKTAFPVDIHSDRATYDIQYGNIERNTHDNTTWDLAQFEVCAHKWADISEDQYGVSLLNDCKYGHSIKDGCIQLTLVKCGTYPNPNADQGLHEFTYSLYPHEGNWRQANTPLKAYELNSPMYASFINVQRGSLPTAYYAFTIDKENCMIEVMKKQEDGDGVILRIYEFMNRRTKAVIRTMAKIKAVVQCNLLEEEEKKLLFDLHAFEIELKPYEIKTYCIHVC